MASPTHPIAVDGIACPAAVSGDEAEGSALHPGYGSLQKAAADPDKLTIALAWIKAGKSREAVFGQDFFCDPMWSMLLHLYVHQCSGAHMSEEQLHGVTSVSDAAARRWITVLEQALLVDRTADSAHSNQDGFSLSALGVARMDIALAMASEEDRGLGIGRLRLVKQTSGVGDMGSCQS